jgi:hypothetical protein
MPHDSRAILMRLAISERVVGTGHKLAKKTLSGK